MIKLVSLLFLTLLAACTSMRDAGFTPLFNGRDLAGWDSDPALWRVDNGVVIGTCSGPDRPKANSFLIWRGGVVKDFELRATVRVIGDNNSGIQYRSRALPAGGPWAITGYQCDIHPALEHTGMTYEEKGRGIFGLNGKDVVVDPEGARWLIAEREPVKVDVSQWNDYTVIARGNYLIHQVNGQVTSELIDHDEKGRALAGLLAIQLHAGNSNTVHIRDLRLKSLDDGRLIPFDPSGLPAPATKIEKPRTSNPQGIGPATPVGAAPRLNVLFIAVDDLGNVLGSARHPVAKTPHLDRLAATGVRFDRAYCQIPLCNPSRASVLTGLRPDATGVFDLERHFRDAVPGVVTLPQVFRSNGWFTARVGKIFHCDVPKGIGTDGLDDPASWAQTVNPKGRDVADEKLITNPTPEKPVSAALSWLAADGTDEEQTDGMIATEAINLMEQHRGEPFFLGVGFFRPHTPFVAPKKYFEMYPLESIRLPASPTGDRDDIPPAAFAHNNATPHYGLDELTCRKALQAYYASASFVDAQIGRVLNALDQLGLANKTLVVLWSDHGYHLGEHGGVWQKRMLFEESARAPLLIRAPGAKGNGRACARIVEFVDIYPTVAALGRLKPPGAIAGRSLVPLLDNPGRAWDGTAVTQILRPGNGAPFMGRSIRTERWRYTEWNEGKLGVELYDHATDPQEFNNLAQSAEATKVVPTLQKQLNGKASGAVPKSRFQATRL